MNWMNPTPGPSIWTSSREWRAKATKHVRDLREMGFSYEEIPEHLPDRDGRTMAPWEVCELANPTKTAEEVAAWKAKHQEPWKALTFDNGRHAWELNRSESWMVESVLRILSVQVAE